MDGQRFDDLARSFAAGRASRRSLVKWLLGGATGGALGLFGRDRVHADDECKPGKKPKSKCKKDKQCCPGMVCGSGACQAGCRIGGAIVADGAANPANPCQACEPTVSTVAWSPRPAGATCDDGDACTGGDVCDGAAGCSGTPVLPGIVCPAVSVVAAPGTCGAAVHFAPTATCADTVTCSAASDSAFPVGSTEVTCTATNAAGQSRCTFSVVVEDREAPAVVCPDPITVAASSGGTAAVSYMASVTDNCGATVTCDPPSGSSFVVGTTNVTCTAVDSTGASVTCGFPVSVACAPDCTGKTCGASDGCGGTCVGTCGDPGPCANAVCDETSRSCVVTNEPLGTPCGDQCNQGAVCNGDGVCTGGFPVTCLEQTSDPCRSRFGTCDPAAGCVYDRLPAGARCGGQGNECNPFYCTEDGSCQAEPVTCNSECQTCDPSTGTCVDINAYVKCADGLSICIDGTCQSPCDEACKDYCYQPETLAGTSTGYFCCPEEARGPNGFCCWRGNQPGLISDDGFCTFPRQVCKDGQSCFTECCGGSDDGRAGVCPTSNQFCVNGELVEAGQRCTVDGDCTASYGAFAVCAGVEFEFGGDGEPTPVQSSGTCCPSGQSFMLEIGSFPGVTAVCCSPGTKLGSVDPPMCCGYPNYSSKCSNCVCSFNGIRRCC